MPCTRASRRRFASRWRSSSPASRSPPPQPSTQARPPSDIPQLTFEKITLPNGLEVILSQKRGLPMVAVNLWYHVGPANEAAGRTGFAHLFEHMMFQSSKHVPEDSHFQLLEAAGASDINGTTDFDRTNYFETVPSNQLELALWLESDRMGYLLEKVDQAALANQQDVVRNERRQSVENQPYGLADEAAGADAVPEGPSRTTATSSARTKTSRRRSSTTCSGSSASTTRRTTPASPSSATSTPPQAKALVDEVLRHVEARPGGAADHGRDAEDHRRAAAGRASRAWSCRASTWRGSRRRSSSRATPTPTSPRRSSAAAARAACTRSWSTRSRSRRTSSAPQQSLMLGSMFQIEATARPGHTAEELEKAIDEELAALRAHAADRARARARAQHHRDRHHRRPRAAGRLRRHRRSAEHATTTTCENPDYLQQDIAAVPRGHAGVGAGVRARPARAHARASSCTRCRARRRRRRSCRRRRRPRRAEGQAGGESINADEPWRNQQPKPGAGEAAAAGDADSATLPNGLTLILSEQHGRADRRRQPRVPTAAATRTRSTSPGSPTSRPRCSTRARPRATRCRLPTSSRSSAPRSAPAARWTATTVSARSLAKNFPATLDLLADVVAAAVVPGRRDRAAAGASGSGSSCSSATTRRSSSAQVMAMQALYGDAASVRLHRDRHRGVGEGDRRAPTCRRSGSRTSCRTTRRSSWPATSRWPSCARWRRRRSARWQRGTPARPQLGAPDHDAARVVIVDKPGSPQTQLRVAGDRRRALVARLPAAAGDEHGARRPLLEPHQHEPARGARLHLRRAARSSRSAAAPGPFQVAGGVRTDVTAPAVTEVFKEIRGMAEKPMTADELQQAKDSLANSLPGRVRDERQRRQQLLERVHLRPRARLLLALRRAGERRHRRAGARRGPEVPRAGQAGGGRGRRPGQDRARAAKLKLGPVEIRDADGKPVELNVRSAGRSR